MFYSKQMILDQLCGIDREQLLSPGFADLIIEETHPDERNDIIKACQQRATELRCKTEFAVVLKRELKELNQSLDVIADNTYLWEPSDSDPVEYQTGIWKVDLTGIRSQGKRRLIASHYPLVITKRLINAETREEKLNLEWFRDGVHRKITARRDMISSKTKVVELSLFGFPVTSESARAMILYLSDLESLNGSVIPVEVSTGKFGWHDKDFVPYTEKIKLDCDLSQGALIESITAYGNEDDWLNLVRDIRRSGRQEPLIYLSASLGSVMVPLLKISPFIVNIFGRTGTGKTVCLMLAASIWGNPSGRGFISESNSTGNALEVKLNTLNNLPLLIDDLSKTNNTEKLTDLIYLLCAGGGKGRLDRNTRARQTSTWSNAILTNLERPLASDTMRAGAINRILDFAVADGDIFQNPNKIVSILSDNYGHAGKMFVEALQQIGTDEIKRIVEEQRQRIVKASGGIKLEDKQVIPASILLASDEISGRYIFRDEVRLDLQYIVRSLKASDQVGECERAYQYIFDQVAIHARNFTDSDDFADVWGKDDGDQVSIIDAKLTEFARQGNFDKSQFLSWCESKNLLIVGDGRHKQKKVTLPGGNRQTRCWVIRSGYGEQAEITVTVKDMPEPEQPLEPLPF